jgi:hypothetical protein
MPIKTLRNLRRRHTNEFFLLKGCVLRGMLVAAEYKLLDYEREFIKQRGGRHSYTVIAESDYGGVLTGQ